MSEPSAPAGRGSDGAAERAAVERYFAAVNRAKTDGFGSAFEPPAWRRELVSVEPLPRP